MVGILKRAWLPLVIAAALVVGGLITYRLHGIFGARSVSTGDQVEVIVPISVKQVRYEVFGPVGTVGLVNYLDEDAQPRRASFATLPWSHTLTTTLPGVFANVVAQGNSDMIGCRIVVNGEVRDEQSVSGLNAQTFCLVKAA
ncbi:transport acessory protein MmpS [Mycobacterium simiae]|uniref:Transport acessory protein MmpS n=1 Tax=Mycobacterium simiae TaxID=1784 RepID=A0A5B1BRG2_MYCSI|nr:MmpS family transport accessory protein [Mycobacterium simiae]KAA1250621.1 transport acessory protein MmpS [Mycobacterium simiae]